MNQTNQFFCAWQHVSQECKEKLPKCSCKVNAGDPEVISYSVQIDCANKSLHSLPNTLPKNTAELDVSNNHVTCHYKVQGHLTPKCSFQLSSIDQLANVQLKTLIADSNEIRSLRNLSGSSFMSHFSRLSLRNNRIQPEEVSSRFKIWISRHQIRQSRYLTDSTRRNCHDEQPVQPQIPLLVQQFVGVQL